MYINGSYVMRCVARTTPAILPFFATRRSQNPLDNNLTGYGDDEKVTGFDAIKKMYQRDDMDEISVELHSVIQMTSLGAFIGAALGGFVKSREAYLYFIENNQATIFKSTRQAKTKLQDYVTVAFARGAYHWGWRMAMFTSAFGLISTTMSVYRGNASVVDYAAAGAVSGALYKANLGLAAMLVGGGLGGTLGLLGGTLIIGLLKIAGVSMSDIRKALHKINEFRVYHYNQALEKSAEIKNDELTAHHEMLVQDAGEKKVEEL